MNNSALDRIADSFDALVEHFCDKRKFDAIITKCDPLGVLEGGKVVCSCCDFEFLRCDGKVIKLRLYWGHPDPTVSKQSARLLISMRDVLRIPSRTFTEVLVGKEIAIETIGNRVIGFGAASSVWVREQLAQEPPN